MPQQGGAPPSHPKASTTNTRDRIPDPARYQVDDLIIELAPRRVRRAGTVIRLQALSFDLLVTLARAAPDLVSFEQLGERVWPGLVITPETIVQRVKLLRSALGDDARAPRYIEGVRSRGYRVIADVHPLTEREGIPEFIVPPSLKEAKEEECSVHAGIAVTEAAAESFPSATPTAAPRPANWVPLGGIAGTLAIVVLLAASWAIVRYRGVSESAERTSSGTAPAVIHSLAVLPLENLSGDKEQEYFADGMTDALTTDLAQIGSLRVISRTSAMHFKASKETLPQIGHELHVDAVVEGTVERGENRVRVTAQLVDAGTDRHLWARTYERDLKDVLALQDEIARDITEQIRVKVSARQRSLLIQVHRVDPEVYDDYLRGLYWCNQPKEEGRLRARDYYRKAIARDPGYALAYAGLADSLLWLGLGNANPYKETETFAEARKAALKALALDPSLAAAHTSLAQIKFLIDWDWSGAEAEYKQATVLNPNDVNAHLSYSVYLVAMGRLDEAMKESDHAQELDPLSEPVIFWSGQVLYHLRRYDDALRQDRLGLEMYPDDSGFYMAMADIYEQKKMLAEAFTARQQELTMIKNPNVTALGEAYKLSGYRGYLLKQAQVPIDPRQDTTAYVGHVYALLNDEAHAMSALELAYSERELGVLFLRTAPELDSIRSSPRFRALVRRIGFPPSSIDRN